MKYKSEELIRLKKQVAKYALCEHPLTNKRISELIGVTEKTAGKWIAEVRKYDLQNREQEILKERASVETFIKHLHEAKRTFLNDVNKAIKNYITFNTPKK